MTQPGPGADAEPVVVRGARIRRERACIVLTLAVLALPVMYVDYLLRAPEPTLEKYWFSPLSVGLTVLCCLAVLYYGARRLTTRARIAEAARDREASPAARAAGHAAAEAEQVRRPSGTVICCSGGGIKSASFCLGGLQVLDDAGIYARAQDVVAVSGGGYAASAFAVMRRRLDRDRRPPGRPFAMDSLELAELRRRTNYVGKRGRTRFDLAATLLTGIATNLLLLFCAVLVVAWLLAHHMVLTGMVTARPDPTKPVARRVWDLDWPGVLGTWVVVVGPSVALLLALVLGLPSGPSGAGVLVAHQPGRLLYRIFVGLDPREGVQESDLRNLPSKLVTCGVLLLAFLLFMPWAAVTLHNVLIAKVGFDIPVATVWAAISGSSATLAGLVASTVKGLASPQQPTTWRGVVLKVFRKALAPAVAVGLFALLTVAWSCVIAAWLISGGLEQDAHYGLLLFGILVPAGLWLLGLTGPSVHAFYRRRLEYAYLDHYDGLSQQASAPVELSEVAFSAHAPGPGLSLLATVNVLEGDVLPTGRGGTPFLMGGMVGLTERTLPGGRRLVDVASYVPFDDDRLSVATASALSGAAFAPTAGRESKRIGAYRVLLAFANLRLGVWVRNPHYPASCRAPGTRSGARAPLAERVGEWFDRPTALTVLQEAFGKVSIYYPYLYVTDGGHYDNLGLVECLRRRPAQVIVLDGTGDAEDQFPVLGDAIATARIDHDIVLELDPADLCRGSRPHPTASHVVGRAVYPDGSTCRVVYLRCVLTANTSWDLESYRLRNPDFPATTQRFEMFDEFDFEAFRHLGEVVARDALPAVDTEPE